MSPTGAICVDVLKFFESGRLGLLSFLIDQLHRLCAKFAVSIQGVDNLAVRFSTQPFLSECFVNFDFRFLLNRFSLLIALSFVKTWFVGVTYLLEFYVDSSE